MATFKEIRQAVDTRLADWESRVEAMEAQIQLSKQQAFARLQERKQQLTKGLDALGRKINESTRAAGEAKDRLQQQIDELQVQLALGIAETRDAYTEQKTKLKRAIANLEDTLDESLDKVVEETDAAKRGLINGIASLDAELEAVEMQFQLEAAKAKTRFEEGKSVLQGKIDAFNNALSEKRKTTAEKFGAFESELTDGMAKIKDAFNNLIR
jgi:hypothetical protein